MVIVLYVIQIIVCACLITLVITSDKQEGLSSAIGGGGGSGRYKPGYEERMDKLTTYFAIAFLVISLAIAALVGS